MNIILLSAIEKVEPTVSTDGGKLDESAVDKVLSWLLEKQNE